MQWIVMLRLTQIIYPRAPVAQIHGSLPTTFIAAGFWFGCMQIMCTHSQALRQYVHIYLIP